MLSKTVIRTELLITTSNYENEVQSLSNIRFINIYVRFMDFVTFLLWILVKTNKKHYFIAIILLKG